MIDVKHAVNLARDYFNELYNTSGLFDVRLEEVELSEDNKYWSITIGYTRALPEPIHPLEVGLPPVIPTKPVITREYKTFKIDSNSGEIRAMKIR